MKYLVIVESPAKKNKIQEFLNSIPNHSFIVEASYGHIRYFANKLKSIDIKNNFKPTYGIIKEKNKVVILLKKYAKKVDEVIIATDLDREGEAIGYHVIETLGLNVKNTKRICFNEITKKAVVSAFNNYRFLDINLFNAQQTRSILDLLIGFEISPLLWKAVQPKLSMGRCQSPALKLISTKENKINEFKSEKTYDVKANFIINNNNIEASLSEKIKSRDKIVKLLPKIISFKYRLLLQEKKIITTSPSPPYITSSIQQDVSQKYGISPKVTMNILQKLYEKGKITYMRTDSTFISELMLKNIEDLCNEKYPGLFKKKIYKNKVSNAQEAHECIRPVNINLSSLSDSFSEIDNNIYRLIYNRTIASQMLPCKETNYIYNLISVNDNKIIFTFTKKIVNKLGYKIVYNVDQDDDSKIIKLLKDNSIHKIDTAVAKEKYTNPPPRYTEASLIKELEKKGIGRPSTFASIVSRLFERKYVKKEQTHNYTKIPIEVFTIDKTNKLNISKEEINMASQKNKLFITNLGKLVYDFMQENFSNINSYTFTSEIENDLDEISKSKKNWVDITNKVYQSFHPNVLKIKNNSEISSNYKSKKLNLIGKHKGKNIYSYIGKYGPCLQYGEQDDNPKYISCNKNIDDISLSEAINMFNYPKLLGNYKKHPIYIKMGKYGYYISYLENNISIDKAEVDMKTAISLITEKDKKVIKKFKNLVILDGPYGAYIRYNNKNYSIPNEIDSKSLTKKECDEIIKDSKTKKKYNKKN